MATRTKLLSAVKPKDYKAEGDASDETTQDTEDQTTNGVESDIDLTNAGEADQETMETFLNCKEFKLKEVVCREGSKFDLKFIADTLNVSTEYYASAEADGSCPFTSVLNKIQGIAFPVLFPGQSSLRLKKLKRLIKNNKKKEPQDLIAFEAESTTANIPYTAKSGEVVIGSLGEKFQNLFNELENYSREELTKRRTEIEQMNLFDSESEEA